MDNKPVSKFDLDMIHQYIMANAMESLAAINRNLKYLPECRDRNRIITHIRDVKSWIKKLQIKSQPRL